MNSCPPVAPSPNVTTHQRQVEGLLRIRTLALGLLQQYGEKKHDPIIKAVLAINRDCLAMLALLDATPSELRPSATILPFTPRRRS